MARTWLELTIEIAAEHNIVLTADEAEFILWQRTAFPFDTLDATVNQLHDLSQGPATRFRCRRRPPLGPPQRGPAMNHHQPTQPTGDHELVDLSEDEPFDVTQDLGLIVWDCPCDNREPTTPLDVVAELVSLEADMICANWTPATFDVDAATRHLKRYLDLPRAS